MIFLMKFHVCVYFFFFLWEGGWGVVRLFHVSQITRGGGLRFHMYHNCVFRSCIFIQQVTLNDLNFCVILSFDS